MKLVGILIALVLVANGAALMGAWRNRSVVRSEFTVTEEQCSVQMGERNRPTTYLHCLFSQRWTDVWLNERRMREFGFDTGDSDRAAHQLPRRGFAAIRIGEPGAPAVDFAFDAGTLQERFPDRQTHTILPAELSATYATGPFQPRGAILVFLPAMAIPHGQAIPEQQPGQRVRFTAKIRIGRNYEPWLVEFHPR